MSQAVLMSIHPEWVWKIFHEEKRVEMRKTRPNLEPPFKVYVYQTLPKWGDWNEQDGHVVGEFVCNTITKYPDFDCCVANTLETLAMMERAEMRKYANGKTLYGWHISDLVIYDKPKELSEFKHWQEDGMRVWMEPVTRPPRSWMYVEELK